MKSPKFHFGTTHRIPSDRFEGCWSILPIANGLDAQTESSTDHDTMSSAQRSTPEPTDKDKATGSDPLTPSTASSLSSDDDEQPDDLESIETSAWQTDLEDYLECIFRQSALQEYPPDEIVAQILRIIGSPTCENVPALARSICQYWSSMPTRHQNEDAISQTVALISQINRHLGCISVYAEKDFQDILAQNCITTLKLMWNQYVDVATSNAPPAERADRFEQIMAVVMMIGCLFNGGQFSYEAALHGLEYVAAMAPWPDALVVIHALLRELGAGFAQQQAGRYFIHDLLANLFPLAEAQADCKFLYESVHGINALTMPWIS